jgi:hypothetical protein
MSLTDTCHLICSEWKFDEASGLMQVAPGHMAFREATSIGASPCLLQTTFNNQQLEPIFRVPAIEPPKPRQLNIDIQ